MDNVGLKNGTAPGEECVNVTKEKFASLEQSASAVEHEIYAYLEARFFAFESPPDVRRESKRIRQTLAKSGFLGSDSPSLITVAQAQDQQPYIANAWLALGYACAASLLIKAGKRDHAWSALLEAKDLLMQARIESMRGYEVPTLDQSRERAIEARKKNATLMREHVAKTVRREAGERKWKSATEAAKAVIDDAIKYGEVAYGVFRSDYPIDTIEKWLKTDPIVSSAFWETCEPEARADFEGRRRRKRIRGG